MNEDRCRRHDLVIISGELHTDPETGAKEFRVKARPPFMGYLFRCTCTKETK